jgi:hypothetical protein
MRFVAIILLVISTAIMSECYAQCKIFTKEHCFSELNGYINTGSYNAGVMHEGEETTLTQTFYEGQDYRLLVCTDESLENIVFFEIVNSQGDTLFSSEENRANVFDFSMESTQMLTIRVKAPINNSSSAPKNNGCISIIVGFKSKTDQANRN